MSSMTTDELNATGTAQVIAILDASAPPAAAAAAGGLALGTAAHTPQLAGLESYFVHNDGQNHALAAAGMSNVAALATRPGRSSKRRESRPAPSVLHFPNLGLVLGTVTKEGLKALKSDERIKKVVGAPQISLIRPISAAAAKLSTQLTWGLEFLKVPKLWAQGLSGKGVRVGHLDTGADGKHPALKTAFAAFAEFDSFGMEVKPKPKPHDTDEHGTHTAATIAGRAVQGRSVGVAPGAKLASAIVIEGGNVVARILGGMDWAVSQEVRILSMSLGIRGVVNDFLDVTKILRAKNILPVFAVGNEGPFTSRSPGNYSQALSVGAHDKQGTIADFSSSQRFVRPDDPLVPDIIAPGVNVISAKPGGGFQQMSGTSMATPHVAGLAALLLEAKPTATVSDLENAIFASARLGSIAKNRGNRGMPDGVRAFTTLTGISLSTSSKKSSASTKKSSKSKSKKKKSTSAKKK